MIEYRQHVNGLVSDWDVVVDILLRRGFSQANITFRLLRANIFHVMSVTVWISVISRRKSIATA